MQKMMKLGAVIEKKRKRWMNSFLPPRQNESLVTEINVNDIEGVFE